MKDTIWIVKLALTIIVLPVSAAMILVILYNAFTGWGMNWLWLSIFTVLFYLSSKKYDELFNVE